MKNHPKIISWGKLKKSNLVSNRLLCQVGLSGLALFWERFWPAISVMITVVALFLSFSLLGLWEWLPVWLHVTILVSFFAGLIGGVVFFLRSMRFPTLYECVRRLERTGGVQNQVVTSLLDVPASTPDAPYSKNLWDVHLLRVSLKARKLTVIWPIFVISRWDQFGIRAALLLLVILGLFVSGKEAPNRLIAAVSVGDILFSPAKPGNLTAWITPPAYTGFAPIFLSRGSDGMASLPFKESEILMVAEGSQFVARVNGGKGNPLLKSLETSAGEPDKKDIALPFDPTGEEDYGIEQKLLTNSSLQIVQNKAILGDWTFGVVVDQPPTANFVNSPQVTHKQVLRFEYSAIDDYGVQTIVALFQRSNGEPGTFDLPLRVPGVAPKVIEEINYHDLTPHPWAGLSVSMQLVAEDIAGKIGKSSRLEFVLPSRLFKHPVAKAIVEQRRLLGLDIAQPDVIRSKINEIYNDPESYGDDVVVYMSLRTAVSRLEDVDSEQSRSGILELLWEVALRIEDGALSLAERDLRASEQALRDALDRNASNDEILELTQALQENLNHFLDIFESQKIEPELGPLADLERANVESDSNSSQQDGNEEGNPNAQSNERIERQERNREDLQEMLDQAREFALTGSREAAQNMLRELQDTLENMGRAPDEQYTDSENSDQQVLSDLQDLIAKQDDLLQDTFDQLRRDNGEKAPETRQSQTDETTGEIGNLPEGAETAGPQDRRNDQIERMDDLGEGDPDPTASRRSNAGRQAQETGAGREDFDNNTRTRCANADGDQAASMTPNTRQGQQGEETAGGQRVVSSSPEGNGQEGTGGDAEQRQIGATGQSGGQASSQSGFERQEELREELRDLLQEMETASESIPGELGNADQSMRNASEALARARPDRAVRSQTEALNQLRQGVATIRGQRANTVSNSEQSDGVTSERRDNKRDPFGRRPPGAEGSPTGYVEVPEESDLQRSREILDELYLRAGDVSRAKTERSYIERLLRWY